MLCDKSPDLTQSLHTRVWATHCTHKLLQQFHEHLSYHLTRHWCIQKFEIIDLTEIVMLVQEGGTMSLLYLEVSWPSKIGLEQVLLLWVLSYSQNTGTNFLNPILWGIQGWPAFRGIWSMKNIPRSLDSIHSSNKAALVFMMIWRAESWEIVLYHSLTLEFHCTGSAFTNMIRAEMLHAWLTALFSCMFSTTGRLKSGRVLLEDHDALLNFWENVTGGGETWEPILGKWTCAEVMEELLLGLAETFCEQSWHKRWINSNLVWSRPSKLHSHEDDQFLVSTKMQTTILAKESRYHLSSRSVVLNCSSEIVQWRAG